MRNLLEKFQRILESRGFSGKHAKDAATVFANNSLDGVYSHGVTASPGWWSIWIRERLIPPPLQPVNPPWEPLSGGTDTGGFGPLNAKLAHGRAVGAGKGGSRRWAWWPLGNNNHWDAGAAATAGRQRTRMHRYLLVQHHAQHDLPGAEGQKIGNNPFIMSIPRSNGKHAVIDCAVSQFLRKIEEAKLKGQQLPVPGGYDTKGNLTTDPAEIEKTWRVLPMGYWKGSGISIALDLIATVLTNGNSVSRIGTFGDEVGLSQIMIAIDPLRFNTPEETDSIVDEILPTSSPQSQSGKAGKCIIRENWNSSPERPIQETEFRSLTRCGKRLTALSAEAQS